MLSSPQKALTQRLIKEVWNMGNNDSIDRHFAQEFTLYLPSDKISGPDQFKRWLRSMRKGFPDYSIKLLEDPIAEGDRVAIRWQFTGTQQGWLGAVPPAGKRVQVNGMSIYLFKKRQVLAIWQAMDDLGLMQQLDLLPDTELASA